jgi:Toprim-like
MIAAEFAKLIKRAKQRTDRKWWDGLCPAHDDTTASLSFRDGDIRIGLKCHAGCTDDQITAAVHLTVADLFFDAEHRRHAGQGDRCVVATYNYRDARGMLLYEVVRFDPKAFRCRRPDGAGGWTWRLEGVRVVPYRLPELAQQSRVYVCEGEKDCDRLASLGFAATCNHGGAGKWRQDHTDALVAAAVPEVVVIPDHDEAGNKHAQTVARSCAAAGIRVKLLRLPGLPDKGDVSDWLEAGHTPDELRELAETAPLFTPEPESAEKFWGEGGDGSDYDPPLAPSPPPRPARLPEGLIRTYVEAAQRRTDAPAEAHTLAAVVTLSALAGSRLRLPLAHRREGVRLVLWGMNVVDSTSGRKTTVNELALDVIRTVLGEEAILPWKGSPEAFIRAFAGRDGQASVFARDEYSGLLAQMKRGGYVAGLAQDFIRAYDGLPIVMARVAKMKKDGERADDTDRVNDPYLVKLCAATRTSFIEVASIDDVLDGLLARFVFTSGTADERRMGRLTPAVQEAWDAVLARARDFRSRGEALSSIDLPDDVLEAEWDYEQRLKRLALAHPRPDAARPAMKRLAETVLKVAALLSLERALGQATVTLAHFEAAAELAAPWITTTLGLIADLGRTKFQARCDAVLATIRAHSTGIARRTLYRTHRGLNSREFDEACTALETQGYVEATQVPAPKGGYPIVTYKVRA